MSYKFSRKAVAVAVAAGLVIAAATTPGYAATTSGADDVYLILRPGSDPVTAGSFTYEIRTNHRNYIDSTTSLVVTAKTGVTGRISGQYRNSDDFGDNDPTPHQYSARIAPTATFDDTTGFNSDRTVLFDNLTVTGSDGTRQTLTLKLRVDDKMSATGDRNLITGRVTPAS